MRCRRATWERRAIRWAIFSLGGQAALEKPDNSDVAVPIINRALDLGVNYLDTSSIYGGPMRWSEQYVGEVMKTRRNEAFLATKTKERTREGSMRMIDESLKLLNTDHVDLWQLHDIGTMKDINAIFAPGGAMEALVAMQEQKVVRYLGVTGHFRPGRAGGGISIATLSTAFDGAERGGSASLHVPGAAAAAGGGEADGDYRDEDSGARAAAAQLDAAAAGAAAALWEGMVLAPTPGTLTMREAIGYTLSRPVSTSSSAATTLRSLKRMCRSRGISRRSTNSRWRTLAAKAEPVSKPSLFFRFYDHDQLRKGRV